ncbi:response regulator [Paenibacillus alkaliterrae]|uniref:response regulator n=1 Tax=Paenibacillus alkaliterrae TaxID=320909 RepID=UPI001F38B470|nr:response regulator [Paenibacillus alkaliterrae]MCF2941064.1 response regulator [Paenibacillus alkaliterrae]
MKALIVDDERHVRKSIHKLIDWEALGYEEIFEAENGSDAEKIILEQQPQLVITDIMMPKTTGIELMEWMETNAADCKKIVISGYNDFEFVRHTVKYGGIDYLLKPIDRNQLQQAVGKAAASWNETKRERLQLQTKNMEVNELKPMYRDKLLSRLLMDSASGLAPVPGESYLREFPELAGIRSCRLAILDLKTLHPTIRDKYAADSDLLFFSLLNICNDFLQPAKQGTAFRHWNNPFEIVLLIWDAPDQALKWLRKVLHGIDRYLKGPVEFGISLASAFPTEIHKAYLQAQEALIRRNLLDPASHIHEYHPSTPKPIGTLRFGKVEERIRLAIRSGNPDLIRSTISAWFHLVSAMDHITMEQLKMWWEQLNAAKTSWVEEFFHEYDAVPRIPVENNHFVVPLDEEGKLSLSALQEQLTSHLIELSQILVSLQTNKSNPMREIARYIEMNYKEDITLHDISAKFHLNREYISRKFKHEFQETIVDFVNRNRVEKAKMLLLSPHLKIAQIAQMVGYQDEKYFSRVFKKWENMTPNEYRKLQST